jgi:pentatricopeptide repeat protein
MECDDCRICSNGYIKEALKCFIHMELQGMEHGREIHVYIIKTLVHCDVFVGSALVDMYGKCGDMESAREVFDETVQSRCCIVDYDDCSMCST